MENGKRKLLNDNDFSAIKPLRYSFASQPNHYPIVINLSFDFPGFELFFDALLTKAMANKEHTEVLVPRIMRLKQATWFLDKFEGMFLFYRKCSQHFHDFNLLLDSPDQKGVLFSCSKNKNQLLFESPSEFERSLTITLFDYLRTMGVSVENDDRSFEKLCFSVIDELSSLVKAEMGYFLYELR
jgi:hypothetical protein